MWRAERQVCLQYFWDWLVGRAALGDGGEWSVGGVGGEARLTTAETARAPGGRVRWIGALIDAVRCALSLAEILDVTLWWRLALPCSVAARCRGSHDLPALRRGRLDRKSVV